MHKCSQAILRERQTHIRKAWAKTDCSRNLTNILTVGGKYARDKICIQSRTISDSSEFRHGNNQRPGSHKASLFFSLLAGAGGRVGEEDIQLINYNK